MARRELDVTISAEGRDKGKIFHLTEMPAAQSEKWAARVLLALLQSGIEIPDSVAAAGIAGLASVAMQAFGSIAWDKAEPLLDEMWTCVKFKYGERHENTRPLVEEDIEEVVTRLQLRKEVLELHLGFSLADKLSSLKALAAETTSQNTETSQQA